MQRASDITEYCLAIANMISTHKLISIILYNNKLLHEQCAYQKRLKIFTQYASFYTGSKVTTHNNYVYKHEPGDDAKLKRGCNQKSGYSGFLLILVLQ